MWNPVLNSEYNFKQLAVVVHVLQTMQNLAISRCYTSQLKYVFRLEENVLRAMGQDSLTPIKRRNLWKHETWKTTKPMRRMLLKRGMGNGEWGMGNGEWGMGNGEWGMGNGEWGMGNGEWGMGNGEWEMGNWKWEMGNGKLKMGNLFFLALNF